MVAVCISIGDQRSSGTIVVTGLAYPALAEAGVDKLFHLALDYLIKWDYISTCGYRIRLEVSRTATRVRS